jgi:predicted ester cyclase
VPDSAASSADTAATRAAVLAYLDALDSGDPDRIAACVTGDFHNEHTSALGHSLRGRDAYRERLPTFLGQFGGLRYEVEDLLVDGDRAAVAYRMTCRWRGDTAGTPAGGMFRFRVAEGAIAHRVDYWDGTEFQRQISPTPDTAGATP